MTTAQFTRKLQKLNASLDKAIARRDKTLAQYHQALDGWYVQDVDVTLNGVFYQTLRPADKVWEKRQFCMSKMPQFFKRIPNTVGGYRCTAKANTRIIKRLEDLEFRIGDRNYDVQCIRGEIERMTESLISLWQ